MLLPLLCCYGSLEAKQTLWSLLPKKQKVTTSNIIFCYYCCCYWCVCTHTERVKTIIEICLLLLLLLLLMMLAMMCVGGVWRDIYLPVLLTSFGTDMTGLNGWLDGWLPVWVADGRPDGRMGLSKFFTDSQVGRWGRWNLIFFVS